MTHTNDLRKRPVWYVGLVKGKPIRVFRWVKKCEPTPADHGHEFGCLVGPFESQLAAGWFMCNPCSNGVEDAHYHTRSMRGTLERYLETHPEQIFEVDDESLTGQEYLMRLLTSDEPFDQKALKRKIEIVREEVGRSKKLAYPQIYLLDEDGLWDMMLCTLSERTPVIFRAERSGDFKGDVTAVFPTLTEGPGKFTCYMHLGQHGICSMQWYWTTRPATEEEYKPLLDELEGQVGYRLRIIKRMPSWRKRNGRS